MQCLAQLCWGACRLVQESSGRKRLAVDAVVRVPPALSGSRCRAPALVGVLCLTLGCGAVRSFRGAYGVTSQVVPWRGRVSFRLVRTGPCCSLRPRRLLGRGRAGSAAYLPEASQDQEEFYGHLREALGNRMVPVALRSR
jgi:hypothetical protein